jgi:cephalosporin hydroxylase
MDKNIIMSYALENIDIGGQMFDFKEYYEMVAERLPNNCKIGEVGIANGKSAIYLAEKILSLGKKIDRFVLIDSMQYGGNYQIQTIINHLIKSGVGQHCELIIKNSLDASCEFPNNYFDYVFIDASHEYELTKADIRLWYRKVKGDGFLAGHDYNADEVNRAVDEVLSKEIVYVNQNFPTEILKLIDTENDFGVWEYTINWQTKKIIK